MKHPFCYSQTQALRILPSRSGNPNFYICTFLFCLSRVRKYFTGMKPNFSVCNNMARPGVTPEQTCVHVYLCHRLPAVKVLSASPSGWQMLVTYTMITDVDVKADKKFHVKQYFKEEPASFSRRRWEPLGPLMGIAASKSLIVFTYN